MLSSLSATTEAVVPVVYVKRHDTKAVKDNLIQTSLLDLQHRITAVDPDGVSHLFSIQPTPGSHPGYVAPA